MAARDPAADLRRIAFLLERAHEATYRVRAFRSAAAALAALPREDVAARAAAGTLTELSGVGAVTARCIEESLAGEEPVYLRRLESTAGTDLDDASTALRAALRGDCHSHSDWSDGGSPIEEMVAAAIDLGHEYLVLTDHSPRLTVARGLSADRLRKQLDVVAAINEGLEKVSLARPFRLLTGIEVDILTDGTLDQEDDLLAGLDVVVGSVHSGLRDDSAAMTRRVLAALENPFLDILGHCTGRLLPRSEQPTAKPDEDNAKAERGGRGGERGRRGGGRGRPESTFDADAVFAKAAELDKAIEINSRPERLDPPKRLLRRALEAGCRFTIDTDVRTRRGVRRARRAHRQHVADRRPSRVGPRPPGLTASGHRGG
jgi:putative hydrolase